MSTAAIDRSVAAAGRGPSISLEWLDLRALTKYASVSERTLREWIHRAIDPLPACQVEKKIFVRRTAFDRWLEMHAVKWHAFDEVDNTVDEILESLGAKR